MYEEYDEQGYSIRIEFDANGSYFGNSNQGRVFDVYNPDTLPINEENGMKIIKLIDPEDEIRGKANAHELERNAINGCFFAGWYTMTELLDEQGDVVKDESGNTVYVYDKWDFEKDTLEIDPKKEYTSEVPTLTLHAAWVKTPTVEVYDYDEKTGKEMLLGTYVIKSPANDKNAIITAPYLDLAKGEYNFATLKDTYKWQERFTSEENGQVITSFFEGLYLDKSMQQSIGAQYTHPYEYNEENATMKNEVLKLYVNYETMAGDWYKIYSAKQLVNNAKADGNYEIMADLTFDSLTMWPNVFRNNEFTGTIKGNGRTISNVSIESTNGQYFGMFKTISADAKIENVAFDGITAQINKSYRNPGGRYAVFAATIQDGFKFENVTFENAVLEISASANSIVTADFEIGFVCADGYTNDLGVSLDGFTVRAITTDYDFYDLAIDVNENDVEVTFTSKSE